MNLRDMHYILALAESCNFNRAAEHCHVSQPTLSTQIRKLEEYLGVALFERTNKHVMITEAGLRIAEVARRIVQDEANIRNIARLAHDPYAGVFRLGAMPTLASYVFPAFVPAIAKAFPKLDLLLVEEKTEILLEQLKIGKIDTALLALPIEDSALDAIEIFEDPFMLAVGTEHPFAQRKTVQPADLQGHKLLLLDDGHCLRDQALAVCQTHGADEEKGFRATSLETLRLMVCSPASQLMTLMPKIAVQNDRRLRYIPFTKPSPSRLIGLVSRRTSPRVKMITDLSRLLTSAAKKF
jgi:LysR family hydrogen peroxide-inducible transcriptional activator